MLPKQERSTTPFLPPLTTSNYSLTASPPACVSQACSAPRFPPAAQELPCHSSRGILWPDSPPMPRRPPAVTPLRLAATETAMTARDQRRLESDSTPHTPVNQHRRLRLRLTCPPSTLLLPRCVSHLLVCSRGRKTLESAETGCSWTVWSSSRGPSVKRTPQESRYGTGSGRCCLTSLQRRTKHCSSKARAKASAIIFMVDACCIIIALADV